MITIYLSDNQLLVVTGSGKSIVTLSRCAMLDSLNDCMYGGTVTNREAFISRLKPFLSANGVVGANVGLVLDSSRITTRIIKAPATTEQNTLTYIANQFSDVTRTEQPVYSYTVLSENSKTKLNQILAVMADKQFLDDYVKLFASCGVTVVSIRPALDCAMRAMNGRTIAGKDCIVQIREPNGFYDFLFVGGLYTYSSSHRLFSEAGDPGIGDATNRAISNVMQFIQGQRIACNLTNVYLAGFNETELASSTAAIQYINSSLQVSAFRISDRIAAKTQLPDAFSSLCAAGDMLADRRDCNLLTKKQKSGKSNHTALAVTLAVLAIFLVLGGVIGAMLWQRNIQRFEIALCEDYINDPSTQEQVAEYDTLLLKLEDIMARQQALDALRETLATYPLPSSVVNALLETCADGLVDVQIIQYNSQTGILTFADEAKTPELIPPFIQRLRDRKEFTVVSYTGYEFIDSRDAYAFSVIVRLTANAGREAAK